MKKRSRYRPRPVTANTMAVALHHAAKPAPAERGEVLSMLHQAIQALRAGDATEQHWSIAAGSVAVAQAIEDQGVVRGLREHLKSAANVLQRIHDRVQHAGGGQWVRVFVDFDEADALQNFFELHQFQVEQLSRAEFMAAIKRAERYIVAEGGTSVRAERLERMAA